MTKQDDEIRAKLETIIKSHACTQVFYDKASEDDYPKMIDAIEALIKEQVRLALLKECKALANLEYSVDERIDELEQEEK